MLGRKQLQTYGNGSCRVFVGVAPWIVHAFGSPWSKWICPHGHITAIPSRCIPCMSELYTQTWTLLYNSVTLPWPIIKHADPRCQEQPEGGSAWLRPTETQEDKKTRRSYHSRIVEAGSTLDPAKFRRACFFCTSRVCLSSKFRLVYFNSISTLNLLHTMQYSCRTS